MRATEDAGRRRVVITGCGAITPVGLDTAQFWAALLAGRSGIAPITAFDAADLPTRFAGEVREFDPGEYMPSPAARRLSRFAQFAIAAALQAVEEAKLEVDEQLAHRVAVLVGSGYGANQLVHDAIATLQERGPRAITPYLAYTGSIDNASGEVATRLGATGPSGAIVTACATGSTCIGEGLRLIQHGTADVVIAGGADDAVTRLDMAAGASARALSRRNDEPERASRPFDRDRDGFVMGAGAGVVVLEEAGRALHRGAHILAELVGYGASTDAYHPTAPHPEGLGAKRAMRLALDDAALDPSDVDYINAHGTSTVLNDRTETEAIRTVFGDTAPGIPISSVKSMTGHMIGAAGAVELIATIHAIRSGVVPPTINCDDPEDPGLNYVPHHAQEHDVEVALSNSFGFAGHNAALVVARWRQEGRA